MLVLHIMVTVNGKETNSSDGKSPSMSIIISKNLHSLKRILATHTHTFLFGESTVLKIYCT